MRVRLDTLSQQDPRQGDQGQGQGHRPADRGLLQQEQGPVRPARAARPEHRPDQDRGQGRRGQGGARDAASRSSRSRRSTRSTTPPRRRAASCRPWPRASRRRRSTTRSSRPRRARSGPGQDAVRLLRLRGRQGHQGVAADARAGQDHDQAGARVAEPAEGAGRVRQGLPQEVEGEDGVPRGLRDAGLQERAGPDADADPRRGPAGARPSPRRRRRPSSRKRPAGERVRGGRRGDRGPRRAHPPPPARVPLGPRAGRALDRPAHGRGGLRARRRGARRRRRQAARRARRRPLPGPLPLAAARGARRRLDGRGRRARAARS